MNITPDKVAPPSSAPTCVATPLEQSGVVYFDVEDPRTGNGLRLYDFEWLVAQRMDGERTFDEIAGVGASQFAGGWGATAKDLCDLRREVARPRVD